MIRIDFWKMTDNPASPAKIQGLPDLQSSNTNFPTKNQQPLVILSVDGGWSFKATSSHSGHGKGRANVRVRPFVITKPVDRASPALRRHADTGEPIAEGVFVLRRTCGEEEVETETITIVLEEITIAQISTRGSSRQIPTEFVTLNYSKIALLLPAVQKVRNANQ